MNLLMDTLRVIVTRAIRGRTWAGDGVFDSPSSPGDIRIQGSRAPFVAIYVDEADRLQDGNDPSIYGSAPCNIRIVIEVGVASAKRFNEGETTQGGQVAPSGGMTVTQLDATDEGLEFQMGLISRQALDALQDTSTDNPWAEIFRTFTFSQVIKHEIRRGGPAQDGRTPGPRYASRVNILHVGTINEPVRGSLLDDDCGFGLFIKACEGDEELDGIGQMVKSHIVRPSGPLPEWRLAQKELHITDEGARAIGIAPVNLGDEEAALLARVSLNADPGGAVRG